MRALPVALPEGACREASRAPSPERAEPEVVGERWLAFGHRALSRIESAVAARLPEAVDPLAQTGAIANTMLAVATVSGIVLLYWYSPSVHQAYASVASMSAAPASAGLVRSIHRYGSDACMAFVLLHALKLFLARRFGGPRWLAWMTGMGSLALLWFVGWLGYWLVWDERAKGVALGTARLLDTLPVFADPLSRSFLADEGVSSLLFFVVFFLHMLLPLAMVVALWLHVTRLSRPHLFTRGPMTAWALGALLALSVAFPADTAGPARMNAAAAPLRLDGFYLLPLALTDRLRAPALWFIVAAGVTISFAIPWLLARRRAPAAEVEPARCNGCTLCVEDCPYDAVHMVPRGDGRSFALEARVEAESCLGCGVCVGACDGAGIDLGATSTLARRALLDARVDAMARARPPRAVAFVCAESAAADLAIDAATGRSEGLPGFVLLDVPCAGWVEPRLVERAVRHGAERVVVVACGPGDCRYREGAKWTKARMSGERAPALRPELVAEGRVRVLEGRPGELGRVAAEADAFLRSTGARRPRARLRGAPFGIALAVALALLTAGASSIAYLPPGRAEPELVVSFKHPGQVAETCRELSEQEKRKTPIHMRTDRHCERRRVAVRLEVSVDGAVVLERAYEPGGIWGDGPSLAVERIAVSAGAHRVRARLGDAADPSSFGWDEERTVEFEERASRALLFDKVTGWRFY